MNNYPTYKLGEISKIYNGNSINAEEKEKKYRGVDGRNYIGTKDIDFDCSVNYNNGVKIPYDEKKFKVAPAESVLVCAEGGSAGKKSAYITEDVCFGNKLFAITNNQNLFEGKYVFYYTRYKKFFDLFKNELSGLIGGVSSKKFGEIPIPLPPLATQRLIVSRIESLFAELDKAVEHLRTAQQQLKTYRQAVLRDAFEGCKELKTVFELSTVVTSGSRGWAKYYTDKEDARFVRITDLTRDNIILQNKNIQYISLPPNAEGKRSLLQPNDVLVSITADLGSIALVPHNIGEAYINQHIAMIRFKNNKLGKFMAYYLKSDFGQRELLKNKRGNGKLGLGLDDIRNTYIPFVDEEEASEIVKKIELRLLQAEAVEASIEKALQQSEALRQSILKKAVSGELV